MAAGRSSMVDVDKVADAEDVDAEPITRLSFGNPHAAKARSLGRNLESSHINKLRSIALPVNPTRRYRLI